MAAIEGAEPPLFSSGVGEPLLLLHGVPGDEGTLRPAAIVLAGKRQSTTLGQRYAAVDRRGARPFGTAQPRDDLIDVVERLDLGPVHIAA